MPAKFSLFTVAALPIIPIALACGGDDGGGKISVRPDAGKAIDAAPVVCTAAPTYGNVLAGSNMQFAGSDGSGDMLQVFWGGRMDPTAKPDFIQVSLYTGIAPFDAGAITPTTVSLTGAQADFATCGACVYMFTDLYSANNMINITDIYMPTAGTLTLTDVDGRFEGSISGMMLQHMIMAGQELVPANDGCVASVPTLTMNAVIEPQGSGSATGKPGADGKLTFRFALPHRTF